MKKLLIPCLILFTLSSCSLFRKKAAKPEDKKVFCETLKDSFANEKELDLKKLRAIAGSDAYKVMASQWKAHKVFYDDSLQFLKARAAFTRAMIEVLVAQRKSFKSLSSIYGQFYGDLSSIAKDKRTSQAYLSNLIDVDFAKEHQEKFRSFAFDEDTPFAGFYIEVVSDFLNDDLYIRLLKPLVLDAKGQKYSPGAMEFRLHGKKFLHMYTRSSDLYLAGNRSMTYHFRSQAHDLKPEEQNFYKNLSYSIDGELMLDAVVRNQFVRASKKKCSQKLK